MELKYLKTIKTILEEGSFQKAAQKLNYTQSTITFQVQQTEQDLNVKLFEKIGRRMQLTQAGRDLMPKIDTILEVSRQIESYGEDTEKIRGNLTVAMPETLLSYKMQPVIQAFRQQAPEVRLSLQALNCYEIRDRVQNGSVDLGVHYDVSGFGNALIQNKLFNFSLALVCSPLLNSTGPAFLSEHNQEITVLFSDRNSIYQKIFDKYLKENNITIGNTIELASTEAIKKCTESNLGISILPLFAVQEELCRHQLSIIPTPFENQPLTAVYSYHKNKWRSPAITLFIKILNEKLNEAETFSF